MFMPSKPFRATFVSASIRAERRLLSARMTEPEGCRLIADFFANFLGDAVNGPLRVVAAPGHPDPYRGAVRGVVRVRGAAEAAIVGQPEMPRRRAVGAQLVRAGHRARTAQRGVITEREQKFADSPLEGSGFELTVRALSARRASRHQWNALTGEPDSDPSSEPGAARSHCDFGTERRQGSAAAGATWRGRYH